jgi:hypothetical protein
MQYYLLGPLLGQALFLSNFYLTLMLINLAYVYFNKPFKTPFSKKHLLPLYYDKNNGSSNGNNTDYYNYLFYNFNDIKID